MGRLDELADAAFIAGVARELGQSSLEGAPDAFLVGLSNGATFAEHLVRRDLIAARGLVLVGGTAREISRRTAPRLSSRCDLLLIVGTKDPSVPYAGGRASGLGGWMASRRARALLKNPAGRESGSAERVAQDWAEVNGCSKTPGVERLLTEGGDVTAEWLTWPACNGASTLLIRILGGGHGWPGGPQYAPRVLIGRISRSLDATGEAIRFCAERSSRLLD